MFGGVDGGRRVWRGGITHRSCLPRTGRCEGRSFGLPNQRLYAYICCWRCSVSMSRPCNERASTPRVLLEFGRWSITHRCLSPYERILRNQKVLNDDETPLGPPLVPVAPLGPPGRPWAPCAPPGTPWLPATCNSVFGTVAQKTCVWRCTRLSLCAD